MQSVITFLKKHKVFLAAALLMSCSLLIFTPKKQEISQKLQSLSAEEKFFLDAFFRNLISTDNGSYVLFGSKPASVMFYEEWENYRQHPIYHSHLRLNTDFSPQRVGLEIWKKHEDLFPLKKYSIVKAESCFSGNLTAVFLIHNKRLLNVLRQHFPDFQKVFPEFGSPQSLLNAVLKNPSVLNEICDHDLLLGIVLGFGRDSAALFEREQQIEALLFSHPHCPRRKLSQLELTTLEEELCAIEMRAGSVVNEDTGDELDRVLHWPLGFLVDTQSTDLAKLRARLKQERIQATSAYCEGSFLSVTLSELTQNN
jgi:hypothetical protein